VRGVPPALDHLHRLAIALLRGLRIEDEAPGSGPAALSALSVLVFGGPQSLGALARAEGVRPPTMSRLVDGLERARFAWRNADPTDARRLRIAATAEGHALIQAGRARRLRRLAAAAATLTPHDRRAITAALPALTGIVAALHRLPPPKTAKRRTRRRFD